MSSWNDYDHLRKAYGLLARDTHCATVRPGREATVAREYIEVGRTAMRRLDDSILMLLREHAPDMTRLLTAHGMSPVEAGATVEQILAELADAVRAGDHTIEPPDFTDTAEYQWRVVLYDDDGHRARVEYYDSERDALESYRLHRYGLRPVLERVRIDPVDPTMLDGKYA